MAYLLFETPILVGTAVLLQEMIPTWMYIVRFILVVHAGMHASRQLVPKFQLTHIFDIMVSAENNLPRSVGNPMLRLQIHEGSWSIEISSCKSR